MRRTRPPDDADVPVIRIGKIGLVECWNYSDTQQRVGKRPDSDPPQGYHWDRWLGPAPQVPFNWGRLDSSWWFDYGGGMLTNWAIHHIDIILWAMQSWSPNAVVCTGGKFGVEDIADTPDTIDAAWEFPGWIMQYRYRGFSNFHPNPNRPSHHGIAFHASKATLVIDRFGYEIWENDNSKELAEKMTAVPKKSEQDGPWQRLFIECVKGEKKPPLDLEESHQGTACCHLANISYLAGRKIRWDGAKEQIVGDADAARLLSRPRRKGYELPTV